MLKRWLRMLRRAQPVENRDWDRLCSRSPLIGRYPRSERARLRKLSEHFLARKSIEGAHDLAPDNALRLLIAAQACVPVLGLSLDWLDGWHSIVVYPGDFLAHRAVVDDAGVVHEREDALSGEAWSQGPVILSLDRVREDAIGEHWGNLVIHEIAHKLDMLNGAANGMPPLHRDMSRSQWTARWSAAFESLSSDLESGREPWVGEYALEDPAEFFATMSEAFFTCPRVLQRAHSELYEELRRFFRQDPAALPSGF